MNILRYTAAVALLAAAVGVAAVEAPPAVLGAVLAGFVLRAVVWGSIGSSLRSTFPVVVFAALLAGMQWVSGMPVSSLPLKMLAVFLLGTVAFRILPWSGMVIAVRPDSVLFSLVLYAMFVRHFAEIFRGEALRLFQARALCLSRSFGPGWFRSLVAAVAALFRGALMRAERFYAAQSLRGLAE
jgi:hypothetical protein